MHHLDKDYQIKFSTNPLKAIDMKLQVFLAILVVGLAVQVRVMTSKFLKNMFLVQLQSNAVDAIFWQFIKPFLSDGGFLYSSGSSSNNSSTPGQTLVMSVSGLNNSNAVLGAYSNISNGIQQQINSAPTDAPASAS